MINHSKNTSPSNTSNRNQRWVIKIGSALITNDGKNLALEALDKWAMQIAKLCSDNKQVVLVSSGAVAEGMRRLSLTERPNTLHELQAAAAVGQAGLIQSYETRFQRHDIQIAQILLVRDDLSSRTRYLNARQTISTLLNSNVLPIVNENDTVAIDELRFGDNDTLAGLVANLIDADQLLILTDQQGVFTDDPRQSKDAQLIGQCDVHDKQLDLAARGSGSALGRGGMATKIRAARLAARSGTTTTIASGHENNIITRIAEGESLGTTLTNSRKPITARKQWLAGSLKVMGELIIDDGAVSALKNTDASLLPIGVTSVTGDFKRGELVSCIDSKKQEIARGLINYRSTDARLIAGKPSEQINSILGYIGDKEFIHRDDLVLL